MGQKIICEATYDQPAEEAWWCDICGTDLLYEESRQVKDEDYCLDCYKEEYPERWEQEQKDKEEE